MRTRSTFSAFVTVAALTASLAGCGGGSSGLSKSKLDAAANAICAAETKAGKAIPQPANIQDATQAAAYFDKVLPVVQNATDKLAALKPADDVKTDWNNFISLTKQDLAVVQTVTKKADAKDPSGLTDLQNETALGTKVDAAATKVGATTCAE